MPKTGTSSIQAYLHGLREASDSFEYVAFRSLDSGYIISHLFFANLIYRYRGYRGGYLKLSEVDQNRREAGEYLQMCIRRARDKHCLLLLSWEVLWDMPEAELRQIRTRLESEGFEVRVLLYLRSWKEWIESMFQQKIKTGDHRGFPVPEAPPNYRVPIEKMDGVFGSDNVALAEYAPSKFREGCIVQDFCARIGIEFVPTKRVRVNESLHLPAIKLLYVYNRFGRGMSQATGPQIQAMVTALSELGGVQMRLHSDVVAPWIPALERQRLWIEYRTGFSWGFEAFDIYDDEVATIRTEADLFRLDKASMEWLARQTNTPYQLSPDNRTSVKRAARQMQILFELVTERTVHYDTPFRMKLSSILFSFKRNYNSILNSGIKIVRKLKINF